MNHKCRDGSKKTMMFNLCQNRYKDDRRKSVTPAVIRFEVQIIITARNEETSHIIHFHLQSTSFITTTTTEGTSEIPLFPGRNK